MIVVPHISIGHTKISMMASARLVGCTRCVGGCMEPTRPVKNA
jgi:hypothetical protein